MAIIYRPASLEDADAIQRIATESFLNLWTDEEALEQLRDSKTRLLIEDGVTLGFVSYEHLQKKYAYIGSVAIASQFRGRHFGRQMMEHLLAELNSVPHIELNVWESNTPARTLYESLGFKTIRNVDDLLRMCLIRK